MQHETGIEGDNTSRTTQGQGAGAEAVKVPERLTTADLQNAERTIDAFWLEHRHNSTARHWASYSSLAKFAHNLPAFLWYSRGGEIEEYYDGEWRSVRRTTAEFEIWTIEYPLRPKEVTRASSCSSSRSADHHGT